MTISYNQVTEYNFSYSSGFIRVYGENNTYVYALVWTVN